MGLLSSIGSAAGTYFGGPAGGAVGGILGGALEGGASTAGGMQQSAAAQQAALNAGYGSQFRPVGITNTFGTSNFTVDPNTGQLTNAGYTLSPQLQGAQNTLMGGLTGTLQDQANIQAMGRQYMAKSPDQAAQDWINSQYALLAPSREQQWAGVGLKNFNQGTTGLKVAQGGGLGMANPYAQELANANALQDLQLASQAQQQGQNRYTFGQGLLSSSYQPYTANINAAGVTEGMGQQPLELSASLAGRSATAGANAGKYLTSSAASYSPSGTLLSNLGGASSNILGSAFNTNVANGLNPFTGNAYGWTTGSDVIPQSTFSGGGESLLSPDMAALLGL